jgi:hypothetical protein
MNKEKAINTLVSAVNFAYDKGAYSLGESSEIYKAISNVNFFIKHQLNMEKLPKKCIIMGNGPSLKKVDFEKLKNIDTFSVNSAYQDYEKWNFFPTYYSIIDWHTMKTVKDDLIEFIKRDSNVKRFFIHEYDISMGDFDFDDRVTYVKTRWINGRKGGAINHKVNFKKGEWPEDIPKYVDDVALIGSVVPYTIQLAACMGYDEIGLVGVDAKYTGKDDHYKEDYLKTQSFSVGSGNNLAPYQLVGKYCEKIGVKIYSCTEGSRTNSIYEYKDCLEFIDSHKNKL